MDSEAAWRILVVAGVVLLIAGLAVFVASKAGFSGLPGDVSLRRGGLGIYVPIVSMLVVSVLLTIILNVIIRLR